MSLRHVLFKLPLPVPTPRGAIASVPDAKKALLEERARLAELSGYRNAIIINQVVQLDGLPVTMEQINDLIAAQRQVIVDTEAQLVALAAAVPVLVELP